MATLHIVNKSPFERNALQSALSHALKGDAILMIEDAVIATVIGSMYAPRLLSANYHCQLYVLSEDLQARGIEMNRVLESIHVVDYAGFVDLVTMYDRNQSWL